MSSRLSVALSEFSEGRWAREPPMDPPLHPSELGLIQKTSPSFGKRVPLAVARLVVTFCVGVAATLAWQSYGDAARVMIANASPQFGWLALQSAPAAEPAAAATSTTASPDQLKAISRGLVVVQQSVDKLAAEISKLQGAKPDTRERPPAPPAVAGAAGRKPATAAAPSSAR